MIDRVIKIAIIGSVVLLVDFYLILGYFSMTHYIVSRSVFPENIIIFMGNYSVPITGLYLITVTWLDIFLVILTDAIYKTRLFK